MRVARVKPEQADLPVAGTYYHLMNRIAGVPGEYPFGDVEKEQFLRLLRKLLGFYTLEPLAWVVMGNHFHLVVFAPAAAPALAEAARRYETYYAGKRWLDPASEKCAKVARRMVDISPFMRDLQFQFSGWFNRTRPVRRRGRLWGDRFKSTILGGPGGVWECIKYISMNPVRAGLAVDAADYRFSSWGEWNGTGTAPHAASLLRHLRYSLGEQAAAWEFADFHGELRSEFARVKAAENGALPPQIEAAVAEARREPALLGVLDRRVRYWSDGLVIGSRLFLRAVMSRYLPEATVASHQPGPAAVAASPTYKSPARPAEAPVLALRSWRRLRTERA